MYLALDTRLDRQVALKRVRDPLPADTARRRLQREARAAARLNHPGIATIHDVLDDGDSCVLVMEYVDGTPLSRQSVRLPVARVLEIGIALADALAYAHARGVVHRDVKPANVMIARDGTVKLLDLGIAALLERPGDGADTTRTAGVQGTPRYMAPEQLLGQAVDGRADVYALGVTLFELLAGVPPFDRGDLIGAMLALSAKPARPLRELIPDVPPAVDAAIARAIAPNPDDRWQTMAAFADALRAASSAGAADRGGVSNRRRVRPRRLWIASASAVIALVVAIPSARAWTRWRAHATAVSKYREARELLVHYERDVNVDRAATLVSDALRLDPSNGDLYAAMADIETDRYRVRNDPALVTDAARNAETAVRLEPGHASPHVALGTVKRLTGSLDAAVAEFRAAIALEPSNDVAHRLLGQALGAQGHHDEGLREIRTAIQLAPASWSNHFSAGYALYTAGRYADAAAEYRRTTELNPDYAGAFQMLGTTLHWMGDVEGAIGNYEHAVRLGPSAPAYSNLGFFYFTAGRYDEAIGAYREAVRRDPATASYHRNLADVYQHVGRRDEAMPEYARAIDAANQALGVNRQDASLIALVALCEAHLGRSDDAERHAAEAVALAPGDRDVLGRAAQALAVIGRPTQAIAALTRAVAAGYSLSRGDDEWASLRGTPAFEAINARERKDR